MHLNDIEIAVSPSLKGSKTAVQFGNGPIYVSPAMYDLITHASPTEMNLLLSSIKLLRLPPKPSIYDPMPMTTQPPDPPSFTKDIALRLWYGK